MDWASGDYTQDYAGTFRTPECIGGIYVLEDGEPPQGKATTGGRREWPRREQPRREPPRREQPRREQPRREHYRGQSELGHAPQPNYDPPHAPPIGCVSAPPAWGGAPAEWGGIPPMFLVIIIALLALAIVSVGRTMRRLERDLMWAVRALGAARAAV
jgi:hypothetical protein